MPGPFRVPWTLLQSFFFFASPWENCRWQSACSRHLLPPGLRPSSFLSQPPVLRVGHPNVHMPTCPCLTSTCSTMSPLSSANDTPTHRVKRRPRSNVTVDRGCWTTGLIPWRARKPRSASWMDWQPAPWRAYQASTLDTRVEGPEFGMRRQDETVVQVRQTSRFLFRKTSGRSNTQGNAIQRTRRHSIPPSRNGTPAYERECSISTLEVEVQHAGLKDAASVQLVESISLFFILVYRCSLGWPSYAVR
ncbi:hypothetical protein EV363DRAFT_1339459 [Boletus edulis]|nr:hypothetical protein EV363DRAFT_1339459 [Boletus edulis]